MERPMRRKDRLIGEADISAILERGEYGVMATVGEDQMPYGVPLSYIYWQGKIYFHCAPEGHKLDNIAFQSRVSFTVVEQVQAFLKGESNFTTTFASAIVFGEVQAVTDEAQKIAVLMELARKYLPQHMDKALDSIQKSLRVTAIYAIIPAHISGKAHLV